MNTRGMSDRVTEQLGDLEAASLRRDLENIRYDLARLHHELALRVNGDTLDAVFARAKDALGELAGKL